MAPRNEDMDWLYRSDEPEPTSVLRPDEVERLRKADSRFAGVGKAGRGSATPPPPPPPPPPPARTPAGGRRPKRRRPVLRVLGVVLLAWLVFLIGTPVYAWTVTSRVETATGGQRPAQQPGTTVLLVGSDAREDMTEEEQKALGTGSTQGRRTDTMMLLHTPTTGDPVLLSLPRDSLVDIPGRKRNKLNAAYAFGGAPLLIETVELNTGIRIDGYLEIGFLGIVRMVDAVGGIQVCPTFDIDDRDAHLTLSKGCQVVDGTTALGYVRMRKSDPRGDLGRMERQREVIGAIGKEILSPVTVLNPVRWWRVNMAAASSLGRGEDTGLTAMPQIGMGFLSVMTGRGISMTVPVSDAGANVSGVGSVMRWDKEASAQVFGAIAAGDTTTLEQYRK